MLIATMPAHNEGWAIGMSARVALRWCDALVVLNHASTDNTAAILAEVEAENPGRVVVIDEPDPAWNEMQHRQWMLETARDMGATHIAIVDADEVLTGNIVTRIQKGVDQLKPNQVMQLPIYNLRGGLHRYHLNGVWGNRVTSVVFKDSPGLYWGGDRFHHREPMGQPLTLTRMLPQGDGGVMHLWGASERRLVAKHRAYKMTERLRWPSKPVAEIDALYSMAIHGKAGEPASTWKFADAPDEWWRPYQDLMRHIDLDAKPSQESECEAMLSAHGEEKFRGLDLFREVAA